jgi:hypothetical protein
MMEPEIKENRQAGTRVEQARKHQSQEAKEQGTDTWTTGQV